jgi:hypothetical protein
MNNLIADREYKDFLAQVKVHINSSRAKVALSINSSLIYLYWKLGALIAEKQEAYSWGNSVIENLSCDLKREFPDSSGFSKRNLFNVRRFYLSAADDLLRTETDQSSIGILLCKSKDKIEVEYALRDINKPIGVSEFTFTEALPATLKSSIPTVGEFENELNKLDGD